MDERNFYIRVAAPKVQEPEKVAEPSLPEALATGDITVNPDLAAKSKTNRNPGLDLLLRVERLQIKHDIQKSSGHAIA